MAKKEGSTKTKSEDKIPYRKRNMASIGAAYFTNNADTQALPTYLNSIGREFAVARTSLGFVKYSQRTGSNSCTTHVGVSLRQVLTQKNPGSGNTNMGNSNSTNILLGKL